ncbi:MAG: MBL fold metallo-hydrolase [Desulfobulbus sp.]|jgi:phosphoribosyl 1,2-cyclic phosphodiesterase|uniref:MBL fold metallo-hydrolase n=1 Tax=Desulfobulbus sp. TaxID=895 RepID=UPI002850502E|nr:MBL fold metallo-hydrolase [Desulfobulbus sp.]MDR2549498.1 MBL fold metallo-hydrolase [Desulfobulbus sp.]
MIQVKFWGVRGSIPCPGPRTMKYGGNTACIELRFPEVNRHIIIDAGSGIRELANYMLAHDLPKGPISTEIYLSHTHWDHIMGFPFFVPAYIPGTRLKVFGPVTYEDEPLEAVVGGQMKYRYFPVNMGELAGNIKYLRLKEEPLIDLGDGITLATAIINHPITTLGYRFSFRGAVFCTAYDTEPFRNLFVTDPDHPSYDELMALEGEEAAREQNQVLEHFFKGADLLVHDAQYTRQEYEKGKVGWGHTPIEDAIAAAKRAEVKQLALFHHDPERSDDQLDQMALTYCAAEHCGSMQVFFAREGQEIIL